MDSPDRNAGGAGGDWPLPPSRLAVIATVVLAMHAAVLELAPVVIAGVPSSAEGSTKAFVTRSIEAPPAPKPATPAPAPVAAAAPRTVRPAPPAPQRPATAADKAPASVAAPEPAPAEPASPPAPEATVAAITPGTDVELGRVANPGDVPQAQAYAIPESVRMRYEIFAERFGLTVRSTAELLWRHDARNYEAVMEAGGGMFPRRVQRSAGLLGADGLAPVRFSDKSRNETAAHFQRDKGIVSFSNNKPDAPLVAGVQDRLSVVIQLAALVGGAPERYPKGRTISIPVASTSEVETWLFTVEGEEPLDLPAGKMPGLKLQRAPRKEFDVKVELWLAPGLDYAPVRLRLTNPNGDSVDQRWAGADRP